MFRDVARILSRKIFVNDIKWLQSGLPFRGDSLKIESLTAEDTPAGVSQNSDLRILLHAAGRSCVKGTIPRATRAQPRLRLRRKRIYLQTVIRHVFANYTRGK